MTRVASLRPIAERVTALEQRQDAADKKVDGVEAMVRDIHGVIMMFKGAKALALGTVTVLGSVAGIAAGIATVIKMWLGH